MQCCEGPLTSVLSYLGQMCVSFFVKTQVDRLSSVQGRQAKPTQLSCYLHKEHSQKEAALEGKWAQVKCICIAMHFRWWQWALLIKDWLEQCSQGLKQCHIAFALPSKNIKCFSRLAANRTTLFWSCFSFLKSRLLSLRCLDILRLPMLSLCPPCMCLLIPAELT